MRDEPAGLKHLAGDLGVDAFVPVGEAVVAKEGEDHDRGEEGGEEGGAEMLAAEGSGFVLCARFRCHASSVREAARTAIVGVWVHGRKDRCGA